MPIGRPVGKPAAWRASAETDRLQRALDLRKLVNEKYSEGTKPLLKVRTLVGLLEDIPLVRAAAVA